MKQRLSVRAIINEEGKALLLKRNNGRSTILGKYELPGGKLAYGEQPEDALRRYLHDDAGLHIQSSQLFDAVTYIDHDDRAIQYGVIVYLITLAPQRHPMQLSGNYSKYKWHSMSNIQQSELTDLTQLLLGIVKQDKVTGATAAKIQQSDVPNTSIDTVTIYTDGGSRGNPGPSAAGFIMLDATQEVIAEGGEYLGITTNNQAEYQGVRLGLEKAHELGYKKVNFKLDSMLVVNQMKGLYKIKNRELWPINERIRTLMAGFDQVTFTHVSRQFNQLADGMVNKTLDEHKKHPAGGFTIVELLIVVVVIAILATITIVAYNGIQQRARVSALQSTVSQTGKKVLSYGPQNSDLFPLESTYATDLALPAATPQATYDYYASDDRKAFCLSITDTTKSPELAYAFTQGGQLVQGRCVKNLVANPSFETINGSLVPGISAVSGRSAVDTSTIGVVNGVRSVRVTPLYSTTDTFADLADWGLQANTSYAVSTTYTIQQTLPNATPRFRFNVAGYDFGSNNGVSAVGSYRLSFVYPVGSSATPMNFLRFMPGGKSGDPPVYIDSMMVTKGSTLYQYGDGDQQNWSWVGTANASASFGPALPQ